MTPDSAIERVLRLDTFKLSKGWESVELRANQNGYDLGANGSNYGILPMGFSESKDEFEFLIIGGHH